MIYGGILDRPTPEPSVRTRGELALPRHTQASGSLSKVGGVGFEPTCMLD